MDSTSGFIIRNLLTSDYDALAEYLYALSSVTRSRFTPHAFDRDSIDTFFRYRNDLAGYLAFRADSPQMIAYSLIKYGYLEHDYLRLSAFGITPDIETDATYAPSVADSCQGKGVAGIMFGNICHELRVKGIRRIILWGGVKAGNLSALKFYEKNGFQIVGSFEYYGMNYDMVKWI